MRWFATARVWVICALGAVGVAQAAWSQTGSDGAIGGQVLSVAGAPVPGALVVVRETDTGLALRAISGKHGEFLFVHLAVGEYGVTVRVAGEVVTVPEIVEVELGEVTEVESRVLSQSAAPTGASVVRNPSSEVTREGLTALPVDGGQWTSLALTIPGANGSAGVDEDAGDVSFRGIAVAQNSTQIDGANGDENFGGGRVGAGVAEDEDAGGDFVHDPASGVGSGAGSVADGGQRAGSSYAFSQAGVREFRVQGQSRAAAYGSALFGHGVGGVVTTVSRSGGATLHGMAFYTARDSAWAAENPFAVASTYADGVITSGVVKPEDLRQQFGGSVGGPVAWTRERGLAPNDTDQKSKLFYFYAFDMQRRNFPAISAPGYAGFYVLTAMQTALLANRGVKPAQTNSALNYLDSLTGIVPRTADQTVNFGRVDWLREGGSRICWSTTGRDGACRAGRGRAR